MEKRKLPNEQGVMVLGLASFVGCCCTSGILGVILAGIGIYLANKDEKTYLANPDVYNLGSMNTWKILNYIGMAISVLTLIYSIYMNVTGKDIEQQKQLMEMLKQFQK
ncbi:CCC motif membrane protein [Flavobacterium sp.]|uniref:CCC motif membrane protein n=1 Tax=Flavobacterium sp. TaxID=239 RepID=UPI002B4AD203|nr:CCC motif membrane protein [Flavobacterium sp.]HLP62954.1 CCC motif membrane protein [Flavobacterium sp.]